MRPRRLMTFAAVLGAVIVLAVLTSFAATRNQEALASRPLSSVPAQPELELVTEILSEVRSRGTTSVSARAPAMWVRIRNTEPLANGNAIYNPGDSCLIAQQGPVRLRRISAQWIEVEYLPEHETLGANCPNGTLFFLPIQATATVRR